MLAQPQYRAKAQASAERQVTMRLFCLTRACIVRLCTIKSYRSRATQPDSRAIRYNDPLRVEQVAIHNIRFRPLELDDDFLGQ